MLYGYITMHGEQNIKNQFYCRVHSRPISSLYSVLNPVNPGHILISCSFETRVLLSLRQYLGL